MWERKNLTWWGFETANLTTLHTSSGPETLYASSNKYNMKNKNEIVTGPSEIRRPSWRPEWSDDPFGLPKLSFFLSNISGLAP